MANRYFRNAGTSFNDTNNWSTTSGGGGGASIPSTTDIAIFDVNSGNCTIDVEISILGLTAVGYLNTLTQGNKEVNIGTSGVAWGVGTFVGSNSYAIFVTGSFVQTNGTFTSTKDILTVYKNFTLTAGTFTPNSGTVTLFGSDACTITNGNFYNLIIDKVGLFNTVLSGNCTVNNTFTHKHGDKFSGSDFILNKDVVFLSTTQEKSSNKFLFNTAGTSLVSGAGNITCVFTVSHASRTISFQEDMHFNGDYVYTAGTVTWNSYTAIFQLDNPSAVTSGTFYNLTINKPNSSFTIVTANTIVTNKLRIEIIDNLNGLAIEVRGDIYYSTLTTSATSTGIIVNGTGAQAISGTGFLGVPVTVTKATGTLTFTSDVKLYGTKNWTTTLGAVDQSYYSLELGGDFSQTGGTHFVNEGKCIFRNFSLSGTGVFKEGKKGTYITGTTFTISAGTYVYDLRGGIFATSGTSNLTLNVGANFLGNIEFSRGAGLMIISANLNLAGFFRKNTTSDVGGIWGASVYTVKIGGNYELYGTAQKTSLATSLNWELNGSGNQRIYAENEYLDSGLWTINKTSGKVGMLSNIIQDNKINADNTNCHFTLTSGILCTGGYNLTVDGTLTFASGTLVQKVAPTVFTYNSIVQTGSTTVDMVGNC